MFSVMIIIQALMQQQQNKNTPSSKKAKQSMFLRRKTLRLSLFFGLFAGLCASVLVSAKQNRSVRGCVLCTLKRHDKEQFAQKVSVIES